MTHLLRESSKAQPEAVPLFDMENLWREAERLGSPAIDTEIGGGYQARIRLPNYSMIRGAPSSDARQTLADAIRLCQKLLEGE